MRRGRAAAGVYIVFLAVAGIGWGLPLVAEQVLSPFVLVAALLAAAAVVATWAAIRSLRWRTDAARYGTRRPPRPPRGGARAVYPHLRDYAAA